MPNHVLMKDPAGPLTDADILYLIQGSGLDCDRKVSLSVLRAFIMGAAGIVTTPNIADNAVTKDKMADNSVGAEEIINLSVGTAKLADNSVTQPKMADNSVGTAELIDKNVTQAKLADALIAWIEGRITDEVGQEALARGSADSSLANAINNEAITRESADNGLSQSISNAVSAEAAYRESADDALQAQITTAFGQITKLWGPTSSIEMGFAPGATNIIPPTQSIDGRCMTVYASAEGYISVILDPPLSSTKVFYMRLRLPAYSAETLGYNQALHIYFNSALDNGDQIMVRYAQQVAIGTEGVSQYSPIFTFVNNGANQWMML